MRMPRESLVLLSPQRESTRALVCIPQAGAGAAAFSAWGRSLGGLASVWAARFPGRENRVAEKPLATIEAMAGDLLEPVRQIPAEELILFGHCGGALVAFELARRLDQLPRRSRLQLVVSGQSAPLRSPPGGASGPELSLDQLTDYLRSLSGTPRQLLENAEFMQLLAPAIRADFGAVEAYWCPDGDQKLQIPVIALGGTGDELLPPESLAEWGNYTTSSFSVKLFPGAHFFIADQDAHVLSYLQELLLGEPAG